MAEQQIFSAEQLLSTIQDLINFLDQEEKDLDEQNFDQFAERVVHKEKLCQDMQKQLAYYASMHNPPKDTAIQEVIPALRKRLTRNQRKLKTRMRFQKLLLKLFTECLGGATIPETYSPQGHKRFDTTSVHFQQKA